MLLLYKLVGCPYCDKVIKHLNEHGIAYRALDVSDTVNHDELLNIGGQDQVPFFIDTDHNIKMYESDNIIEYINSL